MEDAELIDQLVVQHHADCCDCDEYRRHLTNKNAQELRREYVMVFGYWRSGFEQRLRAGEIDALFEETLREKRHESPSQA